MKATILLLLLLSCAGSWSTTVVLCQDEFQPIGVPLCNLKKIHKGDPFAGALADALKTIWIHVGELVGDPSHEHCYEGHDKDQLVTAYGSASCAERLTDEDCRDSLNEALGLISNECGSTYGAQVATPTCSLRFEAYRFC